MKKKVKRFCKVFACALSIMVVMVLGFAVSAEETVTDLTGTTWRWNGTGAIDLTGVSSTLDKYVNLSSNGSDYTAIRFTAGSTNKIQYTVGSTTASVWSAQGSNTTLFSDAYQEFTISSGSAVTDSVLISLITANATQVLPEPTIWDNIGTFLSSCVAWLGSVVTYIIGNEVLTIFVIGIAVISFSIGVLRRLLNTRG